MMSGMRESLLRPINPVLIIILGVYTVLWGVWIGNPFWSVFDSAELYSAMMLFPEWLVGLIAFVVGTVSVYGAVSRRYNPLLIGSAIASWHWLLNSALYFAGNWQSTGGLTSLTLSIYAAAVYLNLRVNRRHFNKEMEDIIQ